MTSPGAAILDLLRFKKNPIKVWLATLAIKVFECNYCEYVIYYDSNENLTPGLPPGTRLRSRQNFPSNLHPGPENRSQTIVRMPRHLMAAPKTTISDVLGILNAVN
jgi:hypothetical protein